MRLNGKKFRANWIARYNALTAQRICRNFITSCDPPRQFRENLVREAGFGVRLKNYVGDTAQPRRQHHGSCCVPADTKRRHRLVLAKNGEGVEHSRSELCKISDKHYPAFALQTRCAPRFKKEPYTR